MPSITRPNKQNQQDEDGRGGASSVASCSSCTSQPPLQQKPRSSSSSSSWHPLEVETGSCDDDDNDNNSTTSGDPTLPRVIRSSIAVGGGGSSSAATSLSRSVHRTSSGRSKSRQNSPQQVDDSSSHHGDDNDDDDDESGDGDTVSLLSDPGSNTSATYLRRRGGRRRRRGASTQTYHPLHLSLGQVTTESKACFPVYGCASFLLSLLVAAIFVVPPPSSDHILPDGTDLAHFMACRQTTWQHLGHDENKNNNDNDNNHNHTASEQDWLWFLGKVNELDNGDRCRPDENDYNHNNNKIVPNPSATAAAAAEKPCTCTNPTQPWEPEAVHGDDDERVEYKQLWRSAFVDQQMRLKTNETTLPLFTDMELVLVGDSLTEHWMGTSLGRPKPVYSGNAHVFDTLLRDNHETRPYIHSTAVGISGDRCNQALYRIENNAVVPTEQRLGVLTVFWVWIGTNDVIFDNCRADQVVAGTVAIVRALRERRPDAWVVIQSLLPSQFAEASVVHSINEASRCLADSTKSTFFYNSSDVFLMPLSGGGDGGVGGDITPTSSTTTTATVNASRFVSDGIHPNEEGARAQARSMVEFLRKLHNDRYYH